MRINEITPYLTNVKPNGSGYICACPSCGDDHHLFVNEKDGKVLMYCQKCGAGFNEIMPLLNIPKPEKNDIAEQYDHVYKNPDGSVAYYKTRIKYMSGKRNSRFIITSATKKYTRSRKTVMLCITLISFTMPINPKFCIS